MQGEEHDYSVEKLWGLGPLKNEAPIQNPQDVVNLERYKVIECVKGNPKAIFNRPTLIAFFTHLFIPHP